MPDYKIYFEGTRKLKEDGKSFVIEKSIRALVMEQVEQTQRPVVEMRVI